MPEEADYDAREDSGMMGHKWVPGGPIWENLGPSPRTPWAMGPPEGSHGPWAMGPLERFSVAISQLQRKDSGRTAVKR